MLFFLQVTTSNYKREREMEREGGCLKREMETGKERKEMASGGERERFGGEEREIGDAASRVTYREERWRRGERRVITEERKEK